MDIEFQGYMIYGDFLELRATRNN